MGRGLMVLLLLPGLAWAGAPDTSPRPKPRPPAITAPDGRTYAPLRAPRPRHRPAPRPEKPPSADSAVRDAVSKVVVEQTIAEDVRARTKPTTAAGGKATRGTDERTGKGAGKGAGRDRAGTTAPAAGAGSARDRAAGLVPGAAARPASGGAVARSLRPRPRPAPPDRTALAKPDRKTGGGQARTGSVCGIAGLRGQRVARVRGNGGCGISDAVRITELDGVRLTRETLIGCDAARALHGWIRDHAKPAIGRRGGGLSRVVVIAGYSCRTRNSRKGARLSEHARGNAIDIAGFILRDGSTLSVLRDWNSRANGPTMKRLHRSACGPFGTVLGPASDRYHRDHFHFDVAGYRSGAYCR